MIESCPFLIDFNITINPMGFENYLQEEGISDQLIIDTGTEDIAGERTTIDGINAIIFNRIVSFMFSQNEYPDDSNVVDFCTNIIEWIAWLNENKLVPKFSHQRNIDGGISEYKWKQERMWAADAQYIGQNTSGISVYNVDIHVKYIIKYENKGRCY